MQAPKHPQLVGVAELVQLLGTNSPQRAYAITHTRTFPAPVAELRMGRVWLRAEVEEWAAVHRPPQR